MSHVAQTLARVPFLSALDEPALDRLAAVARRVRYLPGQVLVSELESGADVFVILAGEAEVTVDARDGRRTVLRTLSAGSAFGEMSSLTGELRSATVSALTEVDALVVADIEFDRLRDERPQVSLALVRELASRLGGVEETLAGLLAHGTLHDADAVERAAVRAGGRASTPPRTAAPGSIVRAWRELVVARQRDCAFLALAAFVLTLVVVRLAVHFSFALEMSPRSVLRALYMTGFTLLFGAACTSLLTFRPAWRRWIALAYGVGTALILNELGVTLAFDIFYKDIHTADPNVPFDIERLYGRAEPIRAIAIGLVVLVQAAYLRRFYRRAAFVLRTRLRRLLR